MTLERFKRAVDVLSLRQPDLTVVSDSVHKGQNLSAIVRTCDAVGIMEVHSALDETTFRAHTGTTMGTHKWVETHVYRDVTEPLQSLKAKQYQVIAADTAGDSVDYRDIDYRRPTALLLGAEKYGILAEARRQREAAGFYSQRRLPDAQYQRLLFEWTQPLLARYCQKHKLPYPPLDDKGDIIDPDWRQAHSL
jgi:tRNA (guanosine-2'-O-)-methyltransferase